MENFIIVLFKNKKKKKIIKGYSTEKNALSKFNSLLKSNNVLFDTKYENSEKVKYELALLSKIDDYQLPLYKMDEIGRNNRVFMDDQSGYIIKNISDYKLEELVYDWQSSSRISFNQLISKYCKKKDFKVISKLNNKIVIQIDEIFSLFSLKNTEDSERLIDTLESSFRELGRSDAMFIKDSTQTQRKWLYNVLEKNGFDKKKLYRQKTTFSKRT
jgi:hypothetical protein